MERKDIERIKKLKKLTTERAYARVCQEEALARAELKQEFQERLKLWELYGPRGLGLVRVEVEQRCDVPSPRKLVKTLIFKLMTVILGALGSATLPFMVETGGEVIGIIFASLVTGCLVSTLHTVQDLIAWKRLPRVIPWEVLLPEKAPTEETFDLPARVAAPAYRCTSWTAVHLFNLNTGPALALIESGLERSARSMEEGLIAEADLGVFMEVYANEGEEAMSSPPDKDGCDSTESG